MREGRHRGNLAIMEWESDFGAPGANPDLCLVLSLAAWRMTSRSDLCGAPATCMTVYTCSYGSRGKVATAATSRLWSGRLILDAPRWPRRRGRRARTTCRLKVRCVQSPFVRSTCWPRAYNSLTEPWRSDPGRDCADPLLCAGFILCGRRKGTSAVRGRGEGLSSISWEPCRRSPCHGSLFLLRLLERDVI